MVAPILTPSAPQWAQDFALNLGRTFQTLFPKGPVRLWRVTLANLPAAADWTGGLVYVSDVQKVGLSNGTTWTQTDGGAL